MINITGTTVTVTELLMETTIGTCNYSARIFEATGEVLQEATAVNGIKLQWITDVSTFKLATCKEDAVTKIAELSPAPEANPPITDEEKAAMGLSW